MEFVSNATNFDEDAARPQGGVNAVEVAGKILRILVTAPGPARLSDIARATNMPTAKAHRYLVSLIRAGLVEQDGASTRYELGSLARQAGIVALSRSDRLERTERYLRQIVDHVGETAAAAVWSTHGPILVRLIEARHTQAETVPLGHVCPLTYSASGLVWCGWGDPGATVPLAEHELAQSRTNARHEVPYHWDALNARITQVRSEGCARLSLEGEQSRAAVAVPVLVRGVLQLSISVFGRRGRLNTDLAGPVVAYLRETAARLAAELV